MADLIDLNSPENKITQTTLPSPLIPPPQNDSPKSGLFNLSDTRKSMDNNPFDLVHGKTVEYVSKLSDPFESVFHKATSEPENSQGTSDDLLLRKKRYSNLMELNRMLDESTTDASGIVDIPKSQPMSILPTTIVAHEDGTKVPSIIIDPPAPSDDLSYLDISAMDNSLRSLSDCRGNLKQPPGTSSSSDNLEKSLLSNSAMNDTLSMSGNSTGDEVIKLIAPRTTSMSIQNVVQNLRVNELDKNYKMRRSFSQGDGNSPMKFRKRSLSTIDRRKIIMSSDSSVASILYEDPINLGFISRSKNDYSIGNDLSQLSAITGLDSANYMSCFTSISNDTANKGFIDSYSGGVIGGSEGTRSRASDTSMQDLIAKYKSLRSKSMIECGELRKKNIESQRQSDHEGSDSVFVDDHEERIIFSEANLLAKTFEDLATKSTKSSGSGEDLSNIQLPSNFNASPETSALSYDVSGVSLSPSKRQVNTNMVASSSNTMEIPMDSVKKEAAFNILRDLEKAAQTKNNPEIMKLLETLGKALGVTTENNLSLSTMYHRAQSENDDKLKVNSSKMKDQKSPKKNLRTIETSPENNNKTPIKESPKKINDMSMKKINIEKTSPKASIVDVSKVGFQNTEENENESESNNLESEKSSEDNTELPHDLACSGENINVYPSTAKASKSTSSPPQDSFNTQKLILDIQLAVGKFLENCTVEPALVLENLNKVLTSKITAKQLGKSPTSSRKSDLTNRAIKSLDNSPELAKNHQKTTKSLSPRRRSSISLTTDKSRSSHSKRIDSPKKDAGKRGNISAPGIKGTLEKAQSDLGFKLRSTVPVVDKVKLRMKNDNNLAVKRGPMKALVPLGKMQRNGSRSSQCMPPGTPPRKERIPSPLKIKTSTPNPSPIVLGKKTTRSKPVASSTPVIVSKSTSDGSHVPTPSEKKLSWNISPVTPNVDGDAKNLYNNTATPNKQENSSQTPRKLNRSSLDRRIKGPSPLTGGANRMKDKVIHGRRSEPLQFLSPKDGIKTSTVSPLKEKNAIKAKPLNLNSKFRCRSGSLSGWEKENQV